MYSSFYRELAQLERGSPNMAEGLRDPNHKYGLRQVEVLFGHNGSGKAYTYLASPGVKVGDYVTPEVTHAKGTHPTYSTLARVVRTQDSNGDPAQETKSHLSGKGVMLKTIGPTDQRSLPGFKARQKTDPKFTVKQWKKEGDARYEEKKNRLLGLNPKQDNTVAANRLLGG